MITAKEAKKIALKEGRQAMINDIYDRIKGNAERGRTDMLLNHSLTDKLIAQLEKDGFVVTIDHEMPTISWK